MAVTIENVCELADDVRYEPAAQEPDAGVFMDTLRALTGEASTVLVVADNPAAESIVTALGGIPQEMRHSTLADIRLTIDDWADLSVDRPGALRRAWHREEIARLLREPGLEDA
jgi:phosphohistidine phosphatase SixA